ncbi:cupin domain-containing protein [Burkholderia cenocepacia]|uniref:cupin domain-containing protein n=1 Tax=Burkholderia cenocepacia TaxID=95486 RepID=UPI002ABD9A5F|nr:cupin domain-containing protein [Burkholderia cenocepacia]
MTANPSYFDLLANHSTHASSITLEYQDLPKNRRVSGNSKVGQAVLIRIGELEIGIWEITPGISTDIESDEFFVVIDGEGTVTFSDGSPDLILHPGTIARLKAGSATTWTVKRAIRKIYFA